MKFLSPLTALLLASLMVVYPLKAQLPVPASPVAPGSASPIQLRVIEPSAQSASASNTFVVEVSDATGAGVPQAAVVFRFAETESAPTFADGSHAALVYTDNAGQATISDVRWAAAHGSISVRITAAKGTSHAGILYQKELAAPVASPAPQPVAVSAPPAEPPVAPSVHALPSADRPHVMISNGAAVHRPETLSRSSVDSDAAPETSLDTNVPIRHLLTSASSESPEERPGISIASTGPATSGHSKKKWLIALAVAGGAGAALAFVNKGKSSASGSSSLTIGAPTVSLGHP